MGFQTQPSKPSKPLPFATAEVLLLMRSRSSWQPSSDWPRQTPTNQRKSKLHTALHKLSLKRILNIELRLATKAKNMSEFLGNGLKRCKAVLQICSRSSLINQISRLYQGVALVTYSTCIEYEKMKKQHPDWRGFGGPGGQTASTWAFRASDCCEARASARPSASSRLASLKKHGKDFLLGHTSTRDISSREQGRFSHANTGNI